MTFPARTIYGSGVLFSGGKDSLVCLLDLLERNIPREKIECWHHDIDGGQPARTMDWPMTKNYVRAVAEYLGVTLQVSWRVNGFWGEVYRIGASWPIQYTDLLAGKALECLSEPFTTPLADYVRERNLHEKILSYFDDVLQFPWAAASCPAEAGNDRVLRPTKLEDNIYCDLRNGDDSLDQIE